MIFCNRHRICISCKKRLIVENLEPMEVQEKMDTSSDSEKSSISEESDTRESNTSSSPIAQGLTEVECSTVLENIGEAPIKRASKITPTYASKKKTQVINTLKRRLKDVLPTDDSEVKMLIKMYREIVLAKTNSFTC
jgi:hypothetical protein